MISEYWSQGILDFGFQISDWRNYIQIQFLLKIRNPPSKIRNRMAPLLRGRKPPGFFAIFRSPFTEAGDF